MSEQSLLYLKRAEILVHDASEYIEQGSEAASTADNGVRESIVLELRRVRVAVRSISRQLMEFSKIVSQQQSRHNRHGQ